MVELKDKVLALKVIKRKGNFATNRIKYSTISEDNARLYKIKKILNEDTHYRQILPKVVNIKGYRRNDNRKEQVIRKNTTYYSL